MLFRSWFSAPKSADEIRRISEKNRMICFPYTKYMNPIMAVNQGASVIVTSTDTAKKYSIPESKWVYLHGGADEIGRASCRERV